MNKQDDNFTLDLDFEALRDTFEDYYKNRLFVESVSYNFLKSNQTFLFDEMLRYSRVHPDAPEGGFYIEEMARILAQQDVERQQLPPHTTPSQAFLLTCRKARITAAFNKAREEGRALIISAFPGTGKSYLTKNQSEFPVFDGLVLADSDSSEHPKDAFPGNYIDYIVSRSRTVDVQFVSSHDVVRQELLNRNIPFIQAMPDRHLMDEYIQRYKDRGNTPEFIEFIRKNWTRFFLDGYFGDPLVYLESGEYLSDLFVGCKR